MDKGWFRERPTIDDPPCLPIILETGQEIASAMAYLHGQGIIHGDLTGGARCCMLLWLFSCFLAVLLACMNRRAHACIMSVSRMMPAHHVDTSAHACILCMHHSQGAGSRQGTCMQRQRSPQHAVCCRAGNVLLRSASGSAHGFAAKVADFGLARDFSIISRLETRTYGTMTHMAPEVLSDNTLSRVRGSRPAAVPSFQFLVC